MSDIRFWFDPVCPFAWMTAKWVRLVMAQRDYAVEWRFISLRLVNAHVDYAAHFPPNYEVGHTAGLRLLRMAAATREAHGQPGLDRLHLALGEGIFEVPKAEAPRTEGRGQRPFATACLARADLPEQLADALDDASWDAVIQAETDEALGLTGRDVGTPIIQFRPPEGIAFFGPVISRLPDPDRAVELWDHVVGLAGFPGFAELKRSLRELPQLPGLGVTPDMAGRTEDWHGGSRRTADQRG